MVIEKRFWFSEVTHLIKSISIVPVKKILERSFSILMRSKT